MSQIIFIFNLSSAHKIGSIKLHDGLKYTISEGLMNAYTWQMNLTIKNLQKNDFGSYTCTSVNALGKQDARIRLQGDFLALNVYSFVFKKKCCIVHYTYTIPIYNKYINVNNTYKISNKKHLNFNS